eukprot:TRINITY_DN9544_c0_g3_i1.p1 TRINITY_DN9544_c0_g3~~TRINITY_DN9544_c0_g3_i1.p1  ORF type:complete len:376 (-),score=61.02 TRINITY_DN9544_c0_g3_i1:496-1623(-)
MCRACSPNPMHGYHIDELKETYSGIYKEIDGIHRSLDGLSPADEKQAGTLLDQMGLNALVLQLRKFIGRLEYQMDTRLKSRSPDNMEVLFKLYWASNMHFSMLQQRAIGFITTAITHKSHLKEVPLLYQLYVQNILGQRDSTKEYLSKNSIAMQDFSKTLLVGHSSLQLKLDYQVRNLWISQTGPEGGYPWAVMRGYPTNLTISWDDNSKLMERSAVHESDWVSLVNTNTRAVFPEETVLYFGSSSYPKYMTKDQAGYNGEDKKVDKALFRFQRSRGKDDGPLRHGDTIRVCNKHYDNALMCGNWYKNSSEVAKDEGDPIPAWYVVKNTPADCVLSNWTISVVNNDLASLAERWQSLLDGMTKRPSGSESVTILV